MHVSQIGIRHIVNTAMVVSLPSFAGNSPLARGNQSPRATQPSVSQRTPCRAQAMSSVDSALADSVVQTAPGVSIGHGVVAYHVRTYSDPKRFAATVESVVVLSPGAADRTIAALIVNQRLCAVSWRSTIAGVSAAPDAVDEWNSSMAILDGARIVATPADARSLSTTFVGFATGRFVDEAASSSDTGAASNLMPIIVRSAVYSRGRWSMSLLSRFYAFQVQISQQGIVRSFRMKVSHR
jgi:hypothetical protein